MAINTTPLGFKKPDGNELLRNGNDIISANAQKPQELLASTFTRLTITERNLRNSGGHGPTISEDPLDPGFYLIGPQP